MTRVTLWRAALPMVLLCPAVPAWAQPVRIAVGTWTSAQSCTVYAVQSGRERIVAGSSAAAVATRSGAAAASSSSLSIAREWRTDLYRDCARDFAGLRQSMEASLGAAGKLLVGPPGRGVLTLSGRVSSVGGAADTVRMDEVAMDRATASVTVEYRLTDAAGRVVAGGSLTKAVPIATATATAGMMSAEGQGSRAVYARLQREVALAVARGVSFRLEPLRVTEVSPRHVRVNYGAPLLSLGAVVLVTPAGGMAPVKCVVSSASADSAVLDVDGSGDLARVPVGSAATFVEADDPAANARRYERVDLP